MLVLNPTPLIPLVVVANDASRAYGATNPVFSGTITGVQSGDNITATYATTATPSSPVGTYPITPSLVDPEWQVGQLHREHDQRHADDQRGQFRHRVDFVTESLPLWLQRHLHRHGDSNWAGDDHANWECAVLH